MELTDDQIQALAGKGQIMDLSQLQALITEKPEVLDDLDTTPTDSEPVPIPEKLPNVELKKPWQDLEPTREDKETFLRSLMTDEPFRKAFQIGETTLVLRSRSVKEINEGIKYLADRAEKMSNIEAMGLNENIQLAHSLVSFGEVDYDKGTLASRLTEIKKMPSFKASLFWEYVHHLDLLYRKLMEDHMDFF